MDEGDRPTADEPQRDAEPPRETPPALAPATPAEPPPLVPWAPETQASGGWESIAASAQTAALDVDRPPTAAQRVVRAIAWIAGAAGILFFGRIYAVLMSREELTAEQAGEVVGSIFAAILIGVVLRWLVIRAGRAKGLVSPWVLVVACAVLLLNVGRAAGGGMSSPTASPRPITAYLEIGAPYESEPADAATVEAFKPITDPGRQSAVRALTEDGDLVGYLIVVDGAARTPTDGLAEYEKSFERSSGTDAKRTPLAGRDTVIGTAADETVAVAWIEPPYLLLVYGVDEASARDLATKVAETID